MDIVEQAAQEVVNVPSQAVTPKPNKKVALGIAGGIVLVVGILIGLGASNNNAQNNNNANTSGERSVVSNSPSVTSIPTSVVTETATPTPTTSNSDVPLTTVTNSPTASPTATTTPSTTKTVSMTDCAVKVTLDSSKYTVTKVSPTSYLGDEVTTYAISAIPATANGDMSRGYLSVTCAKDTDTGVPLTNSDIKTFIGERADNNGWSPSFSGDKTMSFGGRTTLYTRYSYVTPAIEGSDDLYLYSHDASGGFLYVVHVINPTNSSYSAAFTAMKQGLQLAK